MRVKVLNIEYHTGSKVTKPGKFVSVVLLGLSIFLILDASLAIFLGKQYVYWNLEYLPAWYSNFMIKVYESTQPVLWLLILAELTVGSGLFLVARKLIKKGGLKNESFNRKM